MRVEIRDCLLKAVQEHLIDINPLTPRALCQKSIFLTFWSLSSWIWAKLAPIYSKRHLKHGTMLFFPLARRILRLFARVCAKIKILRIFGGFISIIFFGLSCIFLFLIFSCSDWPSTVHTSRSKISERASSRRAIFAMEPYSGREFSSEFLRILVHSSGFFAPITLIWASWERSFPPAEVEYKWCQIW